MLRIISKLRSLNSLNFRLINRRKLTLQKKNRDQNYHQFVDDFNIKNAIVYNIQKQFGNNKNGTVFLRHKNSQKKEIEDIFYNFFVNFSISINTSYRC